MAHLGGCWLPGHLPEHHCSPPPPHPCLPLAPLLPTPPLTDEETKPLKGRVTCPRPQRQQQPGFMAAVNRRKA